MPAGFKKELRKRLNGMQRSGFSFKFAFLIVPQFVYSASNSLFKDESIDPCPARHKR